MPKLTKKLVDAIEPEKQDVLIHDSELRGFRLKVTPKGKRTYYLYYRTAAGQQRNPSIGVHGDITCEQARAIAKDWLADVAKGDDPSKQRMALRHSETIKDLWERYIKSHRQHLKASSATELTRLWEKNILPQFGGKKAAQLEKSDIRAFHEKNAHRPYTANRMLEAIRSVYNKAIAEEWLALTVNPCAGIKKYKEKKRERFLSIAEIAKLSDVLREAELAQTESPSVVALIRLLLLTGCRLSEILTLQWSHIDYEQRCFRLPDSKTGAKVVYVSAPVMELISSIAEREGNPYVIAGGMKSGQLAPPQKAWRRIRAKAGLDDVRLHDLRHSYASVGAASGMSLLMIGALLGQSQAQTTERYAHLIGDPVREASDVIGNRIAAAMAGNQA
jgi:integrase